MTRHQYGQLLVADTPVGFWGARYEDLFLARAAGDAYHFDGELWSPVRFEPLQEFWTITGRANDSIYIAGKDHVVGTVVQVRYPAGAEAPNRQVRRRPPRG